MADTDKETPDMTIEGHAQHLCHLGHEECAVAPAGACGRPQPLHHSRQAAEAAAVALAASLGHPLVVGDQGSNVYENAAGGLTVRCSCGKALGCFPEDGPDGIPAWRISGLALQMPHRHLRAVADPPEGDDGWMPHEDEDPDRDHDWINEIEGG